MIFHNSGIDFWRQNPSKINCKMTSKIAYLNLTHFGLIIRHKLPPRRSQDAHMTRQEDPRRSKTSPRRLHDVSKTTPRRLPDASRYSQDALKTALNLPRHPKMLPRRPKTSQDVSKTGPRWNQHVAQRSRNASRCTQDRLRFGINAETWKNNGRGF